MNNPITAEITKLATADPNIELLWLYGSRANNSATKNSDYDLAIAFKHPQGHNLESRLKSEIIALQWAEQLDLNSNLLSVVDINLAPLPLAMSIIDKGILLYAGNGLRLAREEHRITSMWELDHVYHRRQFG